jgi:hypothetical protein
VVCVAGGLLLVFGARRVLVLARKELELDATP